jgi:ACS family D-galactonate transporter-like MFS transporter
METSPRDPRTLRRTSEEINANADTSSVATTAETPALKRTRVRYAVLTLLFFGVVINYIDRANLALAIPFIGTDLHLNAVEKGLILSAFGWTYAFLQVPGGFVIDRLGPRLTYALSLGIWSIITGLQGLVNSAGALIGLRFGLGIAEAPAFPVNSRVVAAWFPDKERASAVGIYTAGEYVGLAFLTPVLALILANLGWQAMFLICGLVGIIYALIWFWRYRDPKHSRSVNEAELNYIREGGGLAERTAERAKVNWSEALVLLKRRQLWGMYIGQFAAASTLWFFLTWFPSYLVTARHLSIIKVGLYAIIPYIAAFLGVLIGGAVADWLLRSGLSVGASRKIPIVVGMLLASVIVLANYINDINLVITVMSIAFFGQGITGIAWTLVSDTAPRELLGLAGGVFNFFANLGSILTPLVIGFVLATTNSFNGALVYISALALIGALSYIFIVGKVYRIELKERPTLGL